MFSGTSCNGSSCPITHGYGADHIVYHGTGAYSVYVYWKEAFESDYVAVQLHLFWNWLFLIVEFVRLIDEIVQRVILTFIHFEFFYSDKAYCGIEDYTYGGLQAGITPLNVADHDGADKDSNLVTLFAFAAT